MLKHVTILLLIATLLGACKTGASDELVLQPLKVKVIKGPLEKVEATSLPAGPRTKRGLLKGTEAPFDGVLLSPRLSGEYVLIKAERDKWRKVVPIERQASADKFQLCNKALTKVSKQAERSWFEKNKGLIGFFSGFVVAGAAAIGLTFGLNQVAK